MTGYRPYQTREPDRAPYPAPGEPGYVSELDPEPERHATPTPWEQLSFDEVHRMRIEERWSRFWRARCTCGWVGTLKTTPDLAEVSWQRHRDGLDEW